MAGSSGNVPGDNLKDQTSGDDSISLTQLALCTLHFCVTISSTLLPRKKAVLRRFLKIKTRAQARRYIESVRRRGPSIRPSTQAPKVEP